MKKILISLLLLSSLSAMAQEKPRITSILNTIEINNTRLKALRQANAAQQAERLSENTLGETSLEYSPFYQKGYGGVASSELIVQQEFDFPTLYGARHKQASKLQKVTDTQYLLLRRDIMISALNTCLDLATANENSKLTALRLAAADSLLSICNKRLTAGDATIIELNRIKMDRMSLLAEAAQHAGEKEQMYIALQGMGATDAFVNDILLSDMDDVDAGALIGNVQESMLASAALEAAQQELRVKQQGWLPRLSVGYRRNTEQESALNGFIVGLSVPLFSNAQKVKAARLRSSQAEAELDDARNNQNNRILSLRAEITNLSSQISAYDTELMMQTLSVLMQAVSAGQMSITQYYTEADIAYASMQERVRLLNRLYKAKAELQTY